MKSIEILDKEINALEKEYDKTLSDAYSEQEIKAQSILKKLIELHGAISERITQKELVLELKKNNLIVIPSNQLFRKYIVLELQIAKLRLEAMDIFNWPAEKKKPVKNKIEVLKYEIENF